MALCRYRRLKIITLFLTGLLVLTCYIFSATVGTIIQARVLRMADYGRSFSRHLTSQTNQESTTCQQELEVDKHQHIGYRDTSNSTCHPLDSTHTSYTILNKQVRYPLGSILRLKLTTRDITGLPRRCGGDFFQAKLYSPRENASTAGRIVDHNNGTYSISFLLGWTGRVYISVVLVHPREAIQALRKVRRTPNTGYLFNGTFYDRKEILDVQKCYSSKEDGFYDEENYCPYTKPDANITFWCKRPKKNVRCEQLAFVVSDLANKEKYDEANGKRLTEEEWSYFRKGQYFQVEIAPEDGIGEVIVAQKEEIQCVRPLGMTDGTIRDAQLTASSQRSGYEAHRARLCGPRAWEPESRNTSQWLQVDLVVPKKITGIQTQGLWGGTVPAYYLMVSDDGQKWTNGSQIFDGTQDGTSISEELLTRPLVTRFLRIVLAASDSLPRLRLELLGCDDTRQMQEPTQTFLHQHGPPTSLPPCGPNLPPAQSEGYFYRDVWYSTVCRAASMLHMPDVETCLKNRTILLHGDSTNRQLAGELETLLGGKSYRCVDYKEEVEGRYPESLRLYVWTGPITDCRKTDEKVLLQFRFHHFPVRSGSHVELANLRTVVQELTNIGDGANPVVVLSLWAHFTDDSLGQFEARLWAIRAAILKLHRRAPQTLVIFKSPNVRDQLYLYKVLMSSDWLAYDLWRRTKEIMAGLRVAFLDIWDMSACHHSVRQLHPAKEVVANAIALLLSYICPV